MYTKSKQFFSPQKSAKMLLDARGLEGNFPSFNLYTSCKQSSKKKTENLYKKTGEKHYTVDRNKGIS